MWNYWRTGCPATAGCHSHCHSLANTHCKQVQPVNNSAGEQIIQLLVYRLYTKCLQCFDAVGWAAGRAYGLKKTEWWGAGMVICLERDADLHMAQLMPLPRTASCFGKIQIGFTFLVSAQLGNPGKRAVKRVCVCVCMCDFCIFLGVLAFG